MAFLSEKTEKSTKIRTTVFAILMTVVFCAYTVRLMQYQLVDGEKYLAMAKNNRYSEVIVKGTRGEIYDRNGISLAANDISLNISFDRVYLVRGQENRIIEKLIGIFEETGEKWNETLPITLTQPYAFLSGYDDEIKYLKGKLGLNNYATAENCMKALREKYKLTEYEESKVRKLAGVRYEMDIREFGEFSRYVFASAVSSKTIAKVSEYSFMLPGVLTEQESARNYVSGTTAPHVLGQVGPIYAEEYKQLKEKGYYMNDLVGKSGIEKALEDKLRGENGLFRIIQDQNGQILSEETIKAAKPGNSVILTIDKGLQDFITMAIEEHAQWLKERGERGKDMTAAAVVILDVKTGQVLALNTYPNYDISQYISNYSALSQDKTRPLFNRATEGLYRPGSTFKTVVALGSLSTGVIDANSTVTCTGQYEKLNDPNFSCLGVHGRLNVVGALGHSCNIFFYDVGIRLGMTAMTEYAKKLGYAGKTGVEIGEQTGVIAGPEYKKQLGSEWYVGDVAQAAIGQSDTQVTPIQLATAAMTLANKGVRYKTTLIKEIKDYNLNKTIYESKPEILSQAGGSDAIYELIQKGMIQSAQGSGVTVGMANYSIPIAAKSGTPQTSNTTTNNINIGYLPADNPQIAYAVVLENGHYAPRLMRNIFDYYFYGKTLKQ